MTGGPYIHAGQTPEERTAAAREMNRRRWQDVPQEERRRIARKAGVLGGRPRGPGDRCACGAMTLARAQARADQTGTGLGHALGCPFYRRARRPGKRRAKRK